MLLIIFSNLTLTQSFKKLAIKSGASGVRIIQTPNGLIDTGCSYAVRAKYEQLDFLLRLMSESGFRPVAVYRVNNLTKGKLSYTKIK